jgi:hypothetical protein
MTTSTSPTIPRLIPIYTTRGDAGAYLGYPYIFSRLGEWIGWVSPDRKVYSVHGEYVGYLTNDPRVLRKQEASYDEQPHTPPPAPGNVRIPPTVPLAPMMSELKMGMIDVLEEEPELLSPIDFGLKDLD